jgi:FMN phosphatase YigB (HAD superfamily)
MTIPAKFLSKKAFVFGLDNVLYPEKDYLLQVYYLFSEFMAYAEQLDSKKIIAFMQEDYLANGKSQLFEKTAKTFHIPLKYEQNFELLHQNARLPLKLLLFKEMLELLQDIVVNKKNIFLLVDGDPLTDLNKIKQIEWHGLEQYLKVYFSSEFESKPSSASIEFMLNEHHLKKEDLVLIGSLESDQDFALTIGMDYFNMKEIIR